MNFKPRRIPFTFLCLLVSIAFVSVCTHAIAVKTKTKKGPKAFFPEKEFDAGEILEGQPLTHSFIVENKGDEELKIIKVRPG